MIMIAKFYCDCGKDITGNATTIGEFVGCAECAAEIARNVLSTGDADSKLRSQAIEVLAIEAAKSMGHVPKEERS